MTAYASAAILRDFRRCSRLLGSSGRQDRTQDALWAVSSLGDDIRRELRTGREQQDPLALRIYDAWAVARIVLLPSPDAGGHWAGTGASIKTMTCCSPHMASHVTYLEPAFAVRTR